MHQHQPTNSNVIALPAPVINALMVSKVVHHKAIARATVMHQHQQTHTNATVPLVHVINALLDTRVAHLKEIARATAMLLHQPININATAQQVLVISAQLVTQDVHLREIARVAAQHQAQVQVQQETTNVTRVLVSVTPARPVKRTVLARMNALTIVKIQMEYINATPISICVCNAQRV